MGTEPTIKPLRAVVKLRNNRMVEAREQLGYATAAAAARACDLEYSVWVGIEGLSRSPLRARRSGDGGPLFTATAHKIATFLGVSPEWLWPEQLRRLTATRGAIKLDVPDAAALRSGLRAEEIATPEQQLDFAQQVRQLQDAVDRVLPVREALVVRARFGFDTIAAADGCDPPTLEELGTRMGLSRERVRQLERSALARLRKSLRAEESSSVPALPEPAPATTADDAPPVAPTRKRLAPTEKRLGLLGPVLTAPQRRMLAACAGFWRPFSVDAASVAAGLKTRGPKPRRACVVTNRVHLTLAALRGLAAVHLVTFESPAVARLTPIGRSLALRMCASSARARRVRESRARILRPTTPTSQESTQ